MLGLLAPLLQKQGVDPNVLLAMKGNNGMCGEGGWFMWVIFLFFLMGWGGNGWHFNKKMCEWAIKQMRKNGKSIRIMTKDDIDEILKKNNIVLENNVGYDAVYIAHMCLADFYGSSITEEKQMAQFIKDYVDDEDQQDGFIFNRFYADTSFNGVGIPWEDIL